MDLNGGITQAHISLNIGGITEDREGITQAHINLNIGGITEDRTSIIREARTSLNSKLEKQPKEQSQPTIYRVHKHLRDVNPSAYEPGIISIGPYHRGKDHLKMMEDHKLLSLQLLVERKDIEGIDIMEDILEVVGGVASKARKCYADQDFDLSESEFIEMLVLDGCFIIRSVLTVSGYEKEADPIVHRMSSLGLDLMLFENQVPFFVLLKLFNVIYPCLTDLEFVGILTYFFNYLYPGSRRSDYEVKSRSSEIAQQGSQEIMHILDLIHRSWVPRESKSDEEKSSDTPVFEMIDCATRLTPVFEMIDCATRLTEANVKFEVKEAATCLFDIEFKDGTMVIPPLHIHDITELLFRNLIAYEQYFKKVPHSLVTQYMRLLDSLINSSKDVEILSQNGIIMRLQGDDEVVANMVNRLGDLIVSDVSNYAELFKGVNEHCRKPKNKWMAMLRRDYLHSPWAIISVLAAVVLLLLTVVQTVFTILQVVQ